MAKNKLARIEQYLRIENITYQNQADAIKEFRTNMPFDEIERFVKLLADNSRAGLKAICSNLDLTPKGNKVKKEVWLKAIHEYSMELVKKELANENENALDRRDIHLAQKEKEILDTFDKYLPDDPNIKVFCGFRNEAFDCDYSPAWAYHQMKLHLGRTPLDRELRFWNSYNPRNSQRNLTGERVVRVIAWIRRHSEKYDKSKRTWFITTNMAIEAGRTRTLAEIEDLFDRAIAKYYQELHEQGIPSSYEAFQVLKYYGACEIRGYRKILKNNPTREEFINFCKWCLSCDTVSSRKAIKYEFGDVKTALAKLALYQEEIRQERQTKYKANVDLLNSCLALS